METHRIDTSTLIDNLLKTIEDQKAELKAKDKEIMRLTTSALAKSSEFEEYKRMVHSSETKFCISLTNAEVVCEIVERRFDSDESFFLTPEEMMDYISAATFFEKVSIDEQDNQRRINRRAIIEKVKNAYQNTLPY